MRRHERDMKRLLEFIARQEGWKLLAIERTGRSHMRGRFAQGGAAVSVFYSNTPSDFRATRNAAAITRRLLRTTKENGS
jgi:hypothetical protein